MRKQIVHNAHALADLRALISGHAPHEEVEGTLGEAADSALVMPTAADAAHVSVPDPDRVAYVTQMTLAVDEVQEVIDVLRDWFPAIAGPSSEDICYATTSRQCALAAAAAHADVVLVVGSANSSNSVLAGGRRCGGRHGRGVSALLSGRRGCRPPADSGPGHRRVPASPSRGYPFRAAATATI